MKLETLTITEARRALDAKEFSSVDLVEAYLDAIGKKDKEIHAYLEVWDKEARREAKAADEAIARKDTKPLTGIPLAIKDNILIKGRVASAASKMLENYHASYDATVIEKLKSQGVVFLGRTNMDEFALGASTENSAFGLTKNPHDTSRVPGGSSGGSAAVVATGMAMAALGSDTGGSVRQPSAFCGVVGLKPTYGAVSRYGLIAAVSSIDQIGPIGKRVADVRAIFDCVRGHDANDSTTLPDSAQKDAKKPKTIGVPRAFLKENVENDSLEAFEKTLGVLKEKGYKIVDIDLPSFSYALAVYYIINPAEVSTNLSRFDGIRYGLTAPAKDIAGVYAKTRGEGFGAEVRRRILVGTFVLSSGYADAYYRKARAVRELIRSDFDESFKSVDAIVMPTTPSPAFKFGEKSDPIAMYAADILTVPANLAGVPAISVPSGNVVQGGIELPVGFQIVAPSGEENTLFAFGEEVETLTA